MAQHNSKGQAITTTSGQPIDGATQLVNPVTGMHNDYIVLAPEERAKGFVRPVRRSYFHLTCNTTTSMGVALSETYACDPSFYTHTFCVHCRNHFPVAEFVWTDDNMPVGS